jgi:hypothetical protein
MVEVFNACISAGRFKPGSLCRSVSVSHFSDISSMVLIRAPKGQKIPLERTLGPLKGSRGALEKSPGTSREFLGVL